MHEKIKSDYLNNVEEPIWTSKMLKYVKDPSIFIGSVLGYININKWKSLDKNSLFLYELSHKASDDEQHYIYKEIQGYNFF